MERVKETGLSGFPTEGVPTEDSMLKFINAGTAAHKRGRLYIGCASGESLQEHCKPQWARVPNLVSLPPGGGSWRDRASTVASASKGNAQVERLDFLGFAHFQAHVLEWGLRCVLVKAFEPTALLGYIYQLARVSEEHGGVKIAYAYDLLLRRKLAKDLEHGEVDLGISLVTLSWDILRAAKARAEAKDKEAAIAAVRESGRKKPCDNGSAAPSSRDKKWAEQPWLDNRQSWGSSSGSDSWGRRPTRSRSRGRQWDKDGRGKADKGARSRRSAALGPAAAVLSLSGKDSAKWTADAGRW